ncbi:MAG TPA: SAM-dependent methyltransferase [Pseudonocardiaceae bacterium]|jgi:SAM-dependent methyltransferase|nr:SAM-dependent methyltransferase [Pseudonocardiaceae bacterium]
MVDDPSIPSAADPVDDLADHADATRPNAARMYDYMLGGSANFAADREAADRMMAAGGSSTAPARLNRSFLRRAVRFMIEQGVDQFLDLGSGIPTAGNVHEIAQAVDPTAQVVYVDNEPVAVHHARRLLAGNDRAVMIDADLREVDAVLGHPDTRRLIDFSRPVGLLMVAIFHFVPDTDRPTDIVARYLRALTGGGYLAMSHFTDNGLGKARQAATLYRSTSTPVLTRSREQFAMLLSGTTLVEPGLVWTSEWRPDGGDPALATPADSRIYAAVGQVEHLTV